MQKETNMKEGKDERKTEKERVRVRIRQLQREEQQFEKLVNNNKNLKQRERGNSKWQSMYQFKDVIEMEIEELWQLMMKQSRMREMTTVGSVINQSLNLIDKMQQKKEDIQQQQKCRENRQLQTKVWDPGGFLSTYEDT